LNVTTTPAAANLLQAATPKPANKPAQPLGAGKRRRFGLSSWERSMDTATRTEPMPDSHPGELLRPGDPAPSITLDAINREERIALDDFRGRKPLLIGLFRGLYCPFCRRHLAAQAQIDRQLREKGIESVAVVNTPLDRARRYFQYHPIPDLLAAADPERRTHRAFGLRSAEPAEMGSAVQRTMTTVCSIALNTWDRYGMEDQDWQSLREGGGQLFGQFLIDRDGVIAWSFTEAPEEGRPMMSRASPQELIDAATRLA
jgi:peroxiredoxin